jgi:acetyltransferase-like isoleucine patch superfamily enzyme
MRRLFARGLRYLFRLLEVDLRLQEAGANRMRAKYPGLGLAGHGDRHVLGDITYGKGCSIGVGANIAVGKHALLVLGDGCWLGRNVTLEPLGRIEVGHYTSIQDRCILIGDVELGSHCLLAPNVYISSGRHYYELQPAELIKDQDRRVAQDKALSAAHSKPVVVEEGCWLGINVVVMSGVTIGKGAVIGANSVVVRDVAPYTVMAGVPARPIKKRLDFMPPQSISYDNPDSWPYFYAGFELSKAGREKYREYGGLAAGAEFVLCLDAAHAGALHLVARSIGAPCKLTLGKQQRELSERLEEVVFTDIEDCRDSSRFVFKSDVGAISLIVQKAWVQ